MPSVFSHIAVPIAGRIALGRQSTVPKLLFLGLVVSAFPDLDVLLHQLGVAYASQFGHRGASHSFLFAVFSASVAATIFYKWTGRCTKLSFFYLLVCAVSHPLLDICTNGGHGVALFWPLTDTRYFAPFRPIEASPLSLKRFFGEAGLRVLVSELLWVWLPSLGVAIAIVFGRRLKSNAK